MDKSGKKPWYSKYCIVPECKSTTIRTPDKIFVSLPGGASKNALKRRALWLQAMRRNKDDISKNTTAFVCEDHFNFEEDMKNFLHYRLMGGNVFLKNNVVPHIFECQKDRKRPGDMIEQPSSIKRARKNLAATLVDSSLESFHCSQADCSKRGAKANVCQTVSPPLRPKYKNKFEQTDVSEITTRATTAVSSIDMERKNVALEQEKTNEVIEIKLEPVDIYSETLGVDDINWELTNRIKKEHNDAEEWLQCDVKNEEVVEMQLVKIKFEKEPNIAKLEVNEITEELILENETNCNMIMDENHRMKYEHNYAKEWIQCDVKNEEVVEMQLEEIHLEKELNNAKLEVTEITEELILKDETDCNTFMDENPEIVCNRISNKCAELEEEATFTPTADITKIEKLVKSEEMDLEMLMDMKHCQDIDPTQFSLDDSTANAKPDIILESAVEWKISRKQRHVICKKGSKKSFSCYNCNYTAYHKHHLISHMEGHNAYVNSSSRKPGICIHCGMTFKSRKSLDEHTIKKHPKFIASVSYKIYECTDCAYKTIFENKLSKHILKHSNLTKHMLKHSETARRHKFRTCIHCNATFKSKEGLDSHIVKKHPDFIACLSRKIHACPHCTYKTIQKNDLARHMVEHPERDGEYECSTCIHCNATFKSKQGLNYHIVKNHPDSIASVSSKIYECSLCTYKTTLKNYLATHMLKHSGTTRTNTCIHCNATFKTKLGLDNHIVKKHPDFIASVSTKVHGCSHCTYKTIYENNLAKHNMLKHLDTAETYNFRTCIHCNATFQSKSGLNYHMVKKHPDFIASVSSKIHECTLCRYKTVFVRDIAKHMLKHLNTTRRYNFRTCIHCNAIFKSKHGLDYHIVKKHPDFIASVSSKIHECTHCTYKTTLKCCLTRHMFKHPDTADTGSAHVYSVM